MKRFWNKINTGDIDECWEWNAALSGGRSGKDYGAFRISNPRKQVYAHRYAFFATYGYWPTVARHTCDNTRCCNPNHIIDGTQADNVLDKMATGDHQYGSKIKNSILTEVDIPVIRNRLSRGDYHHDIAADCGVSRGAITKIAIGKTWRHVK